MARASDALSLGLPSKAEKESVRQADETPIEETNPKAFVNHKIKKRSEDACEPDCDCPSGFEGIVPFCRPVGAVDACDPDCECPPGFVGIAPFCRAGTAAESIKVKRQKKTYLSSVENRQKNPIDYPDSCEPDCDCPPGFKGVVPFCRPVAAAVRLKDMSKCERAKFEAESDHTFIARFVPSCEPDGTYSPTQFFGSTGYSWCALADGTEVPGTRTGPGVARNTDCSMFRPQDECFDDCECPPGYEGTEPFCHPVAAAGLVRRSKDLPSCFHRPCTGHKDCEDCDMACYYSEGYCGHWGKLLSSPSRTRLVRRSKDESPRGQ